MLAHHFLTHGRRRPVLWAGGLGLMLALIAAAAGLTWTHVVANQAQARARVVARMADAMQQDEPSAYRRVLALAASLRPLDPEAQAMCAYAATVLAIEHHEASQRSGMAALRAQVAEALAKDGDVHARDYWAATEILLAYGDGDVAGGERLGDSVLSRPEPLVLAKLEALRLQVAARRPAALIHATAERVALDVTGEVRALSYLGVWALSQNNTALAEQYFHRAVAVNPQHTLALLGLHAVRLSARTLEPGTLWQAHRAAAEVLQSPPEATTQPLQAMALLVRAQAFEREGNAPHAQADRNHAYQLDPENLLHGVVHDAPARP